MPFLFVMSLYDWSGYKHAWSGPVWDIGSGTV